MHPHEELIHRFYRAFSQRDGAAMGACYHPGAFFKDEVFELSGDRIGLMWRMLCANGRDLRLEVGQVRAGDAQGSAHWEARYTFSATGRPVHNVIDAQFEFRDGLIHRHLDHFDFWRWSRQALGLPGALLGWSPLLKRKVQAQAAGRLEAFAAKAG